MSMLRSHLRAAALGSALLGCAIPEGRFACATAAQCPSGWHCRRDGLCYSTPSDGFDAGGGADAGPRDASFDATGFDAAAFDAGHDAGSPNVDSGPDAIVTCIPVTELCNNAIDDDCDGTVDCGDTSCAFEPCGPDAPRGWQRCCLGRCVDFRTELSPQHCSTCMFPCAAGQICSMRDGFPTCTCNAAADCFPTAGGPFNCMGGFCTCQSADYCGGGQDCIVAGNGAYCGYL